MASKSFLTLYLLQLAANPLRTKALTSGVLSGLQEATAQKLSGSKQLDERVLQMAAYSFLVSGPLNHVLYEVMNRLFAGKQVYIAAMTALAGKASITQIKKAVQQGLLPMQKMSWIISPVALIIAQKFISQQVWVPFFNIIAFVFGTYINTMMKRKRIAEAKK
ncbi:hypothetical protein BDF14DRAFT_1877208 [Spinellus fusiger]|nr:hypothetical protein BDF14DRAFT_1877208 [Spinellus fusiger]